MSLFILASFYQFFFVDTYQVVSVEGNAVDVIRQFHIFINIHF